MIPAGRPVILWLLPSLILALSSMSSSRAQGGAEPLGPTQTQEELDRRAARAAIQLVNQSDEGAQAVARSIRNPSSPEAQRLMLRELARSAAPDHPHITLALGDLLSVQNPLLTNEALRALSAAHSREAVGLVMGLLVGNRGPIPPDIRAQAMATLERQTGKAQFGTDASAWSKWWQTAQFLPEAQWRSQMARDHAARADTLQHAYDQMLERMVDLQRQLYLVSSEDERPRILATLIESDIRPLKILGMQLTERRLLNARPIDDTIARALIAALDEDEPEIRALSAAILARLGTPESSQALLRALLRESHPHASAALLRATSRQPQPALLSPALQWLEAGGDARAAAIETLNAVTNTGVELSPAQAARAGAALTSLPGASLTEPEMALLVELDQTPAVLAKLRSPDSAEAVAAARVLSAKGVAIDALVRAAMDNAALATEALNALARHRGDRDGLALAASVADPANPTHRARVLIMARELEPAALLRLAQDQPDARRREMILQPAGEAAFYTSRHQTVAQVEASIALAHVRIDLEDLAGARAALTQFPSRWRGPRIDAIDIELALCDERYDEAAARTISAALGTGHAGLVLEPWTRTLSRPPSVPAIDALQSILASLADVLTPSDLDMLEQLVGPAPSGAPNPSSTTDDHSPSRVEAPTDSDGHDDGGESSP